MLRDSTAASVLRRAVSLVATTLVAISLTFLFFAYTIDQVKAPGRLASALVDHLGALLLHLDMGPSALSVEIPVQQVLRDGRAIWVPVLVVGTPLGAQLMRMTAGAVRDALGEEYIRTARAKGLGERRVVALHALPTAATPLAMLAGVNMSLLVTSIVLMESAFSLPGSFRFIDDAIALRVSGG